MRQSLFMKKLWLEIKPIIFLFIVWRLVLVGIRAVGPTIFTPHETFWGPSPWANFDGIHYLTIAKEHYYQYQQAFFPLFPLLIRLFSWVTRVPEVWVAIGISHVSTIFGLYFFYKLSYRYRKHNGLWCIILFLLFPTSFFFAAVYPESLYFALAAGALYALEKRRWWWVGLAGMLASGTRLFGVYILIPAILEYSVVKKKQIKDILGLGLIPLGLVIYMIYLWQTVGDPLAFFHVQSAFGANRSSGQLVFLPQVLWRYLKILFTVDPSSFSYMIASFELLAFIFTVYLFVKGVQKKLKLSLLLYAAAVVITPTLTGTLSSFPRYLLAAFPLFFTLGSLPERTKILLALLFGLALIYFASAFLQGYFVA